ncbi:Aldo/keto reductase family protein [Streptomyces sp. ADI95-16]|uniref:aldo/keto reductase n=1 Tax=Streptomyces sp. ADI95-16 TaxID=1522758 RepID=UPI000F3A9FB7|nr:aldo/keto reductase [Streptomyces sp. ADI95-16]AYV30767.1 Aldo/keto reductase family protein [Streptomyces sp. ADI95-16]
MSAFLSLGTYRVRAVSQAARTALAAGSPWVDTAPNYAHGRAHEELRPVLGEYPSVRVATKTGFFTEEQGRTALAEGTLTREETASRHSLEPGFVRWQTERSLTTLGRVDLMFVHNPEHHSHGLDHAALHWRVREAFTALEEFAHAGRIGGYGVATWTGLTSEAFTVPELLALARQAAGSAEHHFTALQMPVSLVMDDLIRQALDGGGPLVQAKDAGLITFGSAPLHGGELLEAMTPELVDFIRPGLSAAAAALLAAGSCPGLDVVLTSASTREHWDDAAKALAAPLTAEELRRVTDELAAE